MSARNCPFEETCASLYVAFFEKYPNNDLRGRVSMAMAALLKRKTSFAGAAAGWAAGLVYAVGSRGVGVPDVHGVSGRTLMEAMRDDVTKALDEMLSRDLRDDNSVETRVRRTLRSRLKSSWGKRPQILVEILRVDD